MTNMSNIVKEYNKLLEITQKNKLKVSIPTLYSKVNGKKYSLRGLMFVFFGMNLNKIMNKKQLVEFLKKYKCSSVDPQPRHFGMQTGLDFLIMGSFHNKSKRVLKPGEYCLRSLRTYHPNRIFNHRNNSKMFTSSVWEKLKKKYDNRCACCGSKEGENNFKNKNVLTFLQKGHKDPRCELTVNNCIPLCSVCNYAYKNDYIFSSNGFVKKI